MHKKIILVVDDCAINIALIDALVGEDYNILGASDAQTAIEIATSTPTPDLILLDVMMPNMDGYEVCRQLKSQRTTRSIPVIFVTAKVTAEDKLKSLDSGALGHITKPIDTEALKEAIDIALNET